MQFDPFKQQNSFYRYNLQISKEEINQILILVSSSEKKEQKTTFKSLNVLNFPILKKLKKQITSILDKKKLILTDNWAQLYNNEDSHGVHTHPNSCYSGIIYIQGNSPTVFYNKDISFTYLEEFKNNKLLLFPSFVPHEVKPLKLNENRLIISFNSIKI